MSVGETETGIPVPTRKQPKCGVTSDRVRALRVGESFLVTTYKECDSCRNIARYIGIRMATRKIPGEGWRVWRVEDASEEG